MTAETYELLFFTELAGLPVFDLKQRRIGRVRDAAIVPLIHPARVDRFLVEARARPGFPSVTIRLPPSRSTAFSFQTRRLYPYHSDEYMLRIGATCSISRSST